MGAAFATQAKTATKTRVKKRIIPPAMKKLKFADLIIASGKALPHFV
jgi:hypothetical protein